MHNQISQAVTMFTAEILLVFAIATFINNNIEDNASEEKSNDSGTGYKQNQ